MQLPFSFPALQHTYAIEITHLLVTRACNSVVECSLRMREVGGSIPLKSIYHFFFPLSLPRLSLCYCFPITRDINYVLFMLSLYAFVHYILRIADDSFF